MPRYETRLLYLTAKQQSRLPTINVTTIRVAFTHNSTVLWDNIIKMVSGTDEPLSVGSDEPHFSMQFDINLNYKLYEYVSEVTSGRYVGPIMR